MHAKLAGQLSLHDMITSVLADAREKVAADEEKKEESSDKVKKLLKYEKKEHGGKIPSVKEEEAEKKASAIDPSDPEDIEKLASALEVMADTLEKTADSVELGGESRQGGEVLSTMSKVPGKQSNKKDSSKAHNVPMSTGLETKKETGPAKTAVPDTQHTGHVPVTAAYPKKGVLKTAAASVKELIEAKRAAEAGEPAPEQKAEQKTEAAPEVTDEKRAAAVSFIQSKLAAFSNIEKKMGGETLDSPSGEGPKPESGSKGGNSVRSNISSNQAAINMKKVDGKGPQKKMLSEVLTEPAQSKAHDSKVQENLRNASKGGVKIAAAKQLLQKIAGEGCTCDSKGDCQYCKMKKAMDKKSAATEAK